MRGTRTRDASISSLPKPSHDDMILPAVARRIKEEGLFNHDVIAYSDDYNAPLYRLPTTLGTVGNPFASYEREKAASSTNLSSPRGQPSPNGRQFDGPADEIPTSNRHEADPIKKAHENHSSSGSTPVPREPSPTPLERRETPSSSPIPEAIPQVSTPPRERRAAKESDIILTAVPEPSTQAGSRPDRPRRTRRNTEGRQRVDLPEQEPYIRQQSPTSDRKGQISENDIQALDVRGAMQGNDRSNRQQRRRSKTMEQERYNVSSDFYSDIQTVEAAQLAVPKKPATAHQQHESSSGYQRRQNQYPNNEGGNLYAQQYDQQYSNNNNHQGRQYRNEEPAQRSSKNQYDRPQQQAQDNYNYGHQQSQQQHQQYHEESKYAQESQYSQRQQRQQKQHYPQPDDQTQRQNHAQGGKGRYNQQQSYGVDHVQGYDNQDYERRQPSRQHDDQSRFAQATAHIEMSQLNPEPQHDTLNNNPEVIDRPKMKKGAVCCIIC
ncbi:hypothetical protein BG003_007648 [Podila horticola]|nr:hypothetical protein BG003_007648 [Podila horticola]